MFGAKQQDPHAGGSYKEAVNRPGSATQADVFDFRAMSTDESEKAAMFWMNAGDPQKVDVPLFPLTRNFVRGQPARPRCGVIATASLAEHGPGC